MASPLFRRKNIDQLISDCEGAEFRLKKSLGWLSLTSLGIGAVIGSGIFTIVGTAIAGQKFQASSILNAPLLQYLIHHNASSGRPGAGPAIAISFILVAIACGKTSLGPLLDEFIVWIEKFPAPAGIKRAVELRGQKSGGSFVPLAPDTRRALDDFAAWFKAWLPAMKKVIR